MLGMAKATGTTTDDERFVLALDQGTTSCRAAAVDARGNIVATAQREFTQFYPHPGWVEHDAAEIWSVQEAVLREVVEKVGGAARLSLIHI